MMCACLVLRLEPRNSQFEHVLAVGAKLNDEPELLLRDLTLASIVFAPSTCSIGRRVMIDQVFLGCGRLSLALFRKNWKK